MTADLSKKSSCVMISLVYVGLLQLVVHCILENSCGAARFNDLQNFGCHLQGLIDIRVSVCLG